jgi:predicted permease
MFPLFLTLGFLVAGGQESLRTVLRFPPFIALIIGLFLNILGLQPLPYLAVILTTIGWTTLPVTIFLIGAKVKLRSGAPLRTVSIALSLRMVLVPIILSGIYLLHGTFGLSHRVSLLESAMPPALSTSILAMHHQLDEELTISAIGLGTILFIILAFLASLLP